MKRIKTLTTMALVLALVAGCKQANTPSSARDEERNGASTDLAQRNANEDRAAESMGIPSTPADRNYQSAISAAEAAHRAAMDRCLVLPVSEQQTCRDRADADLAAAAKSAQDARDAGMPATTPPSP